jgi:sec-independent protein translocase protein TatC
MRPTEDDLFAEEQAMPSMSFGDHLEELRARIILALIGLAVGVALTFIPPLNLGQLIFKQMQDPAQDALERFRTAEAAKRAKEADELRRETEPFVVTIVATDLAKAMRELDPGWESPAEADLAGRIVSLPMRFPVSSWITTVNQTTQKNRVIVALAPLEGFMIFFTVSLVAGLVIASPWVFYQAWAFVAAGLYRHERNYVLRFLPFSVGLFLSGVLLCFFLVLPITLQFLMEFNVWLGIEPSLRLSDWMSFATMMPLIFGIAFQTPLAMMLLERVGIFTAADYRSNRKYAIFGIVVAAAVITPTGDPFTLLILALPVIALFELGIVLVSRRQPAEAVAA